MINWILNTWLGRITFLGATIIISFSIQHALDPESTNPTTFAVSIVPEIIGIALTVLFFDALIKSREQRNWDGVRKKALRRVRDTLFSLETGIRYGRPISQGELLDIQEKQSETWKKGLQHKDMLKLWVDTSKKVPIAERFGTADNMYWGSLASTFRNAVESAERAVDLHSNLIPPNLVEALEDIAIQGRTLQSNLQILSTIVPDKIDLRVVDMHLTIVFDTYTKCWDALETSREK